ncbi:hypothetical protein A0256_10850 [Mucilaginibacter sp. PAMC 26640]|nr:hypothetical protein A0256_10850 [Mucilaginibacter sp. PAMC 26640]
MSHYPTKNIKRFSFFVIFAFSQILCFPAHAQRTLGINADGDVLSGSNRNSGGTIRQDGWWVAINSGYEAPLSDLGEVYKGAPTFGFTLAKRTGHLVFSGTADYRSYHPKQGQFSYSYDDQNALTATYSKFRGIGLYAGLAYQLPITGLIDLYGGVNGGVIISKYSLSATDGQFISVSAEYDNGSISYFGPKLGFNFLVGGNFSISLEGRYSLSLTGANYNSREGSSVTKGFSSYAANVFLVYGF